MGADAPPLQLSTQSHAYPQGAVLVVGTIGFYGPVEAARVQRTALGNQPVATRVAQLEAHMLRKGGGRQDYTVVVVGLPDVGGSAPAGPAAPSTGPASGQATGGPAALAPLGLVAPGGAGWLGDVVQVIAQVGLAAAAVVLVVWGAWRIAQLLGGRATRGPTGPARDVCGACVPHHSSTDPAWFEGSVDGMPLPPKYRVELFERIVEALEQHQRASSRQAPFRAVTDELSGLAKQVAKDMAAKGLWGLLASRITDPVLRLPVRGVLSDGVRYLAAVDDLAASVHEGVEANLIDAGVAQAIAHRIATFAEAVVTPAHRDPHSLVGMRGHAEMAWLAEHNPQAWAFVVLNVEQALAEVRAVFPEGSPLHEYGQQYERQLHDMALSRVLPVGYSERDAREAFDSVAASVADVLGKPWREGRTKDAYLSRSVRKHVEAQVAEVRARRWASVTDEELADEIGKRARDLAATADMLELDRPDMRDLLYPAAFLTFWAGVTSDRTIILGVTVELLAARMFATLLQPADELAAELLDPAIRQSEMAPLTPEQRTLREIVAHFDALHLRLHRELRDGTDRPAALPIDPEVEDGELGNGWRHPGLLTAAIGGGLVGLNLLGRPGTARAADGTGPVDPGWIGQVVDALGATTIGVVGGLVLAGATWIAVRVGRNLADAGAAEPVPGFTHIGPDERRLVQAAASALRAAGSARVLSPSGTTEDLVLPQRDALIDQLVRDGTKRRQATEIVDSMLAVGPAVGGRNEFVVVEQTHDLLVQVGLLEAVLDHERLHHPRQAHAADAAADAAHALDLIARIEARSTMPAGIPMVGVGGGVRVPHGTPASAGQQPPRGGLVHGVSTRLALARAVHDTAFERSYAGEHPDVLDLIRGVIGEWLAGDLAGPKTDAFDREAGHGPLGPRGPPLAVVFHSAPRTVGHRWDDGVLHIYANDVAGIGYALTAGAFGPALGLDTEQSVEVATLVEAFVGANRGWLPPRAADEFTDLVKRDMRAMADVVAGYGTRRSRMIDVLPAGDRRWHHVGIAAVKELQAVALNALAEPSRSRSWGRDGLFGAGIDPDSGAIVALNPLLLRELQLELPGLLARGRRSNDPALQHALFPQGTVRLEVVPGLLAAYERIGRLPGLAHPIPLHITESRAFGRMTVYVDPIVIAALDPVARSGFAAQARTTQLLPPFAGPDELRGVAGIRPLTGALIARVTQMLDAAEALLSRLAVATPSLRRSEIAAISDLLDRAGYFQVRAADRDWLDVTERLARSRHRLAAARRADPLDLADWMLGHSEMAASIMRIFDADPGALIPFHFIAGRLGAEVAALRDATFLAPYLSLEDDFVTFLPASAIAAGFVPAVRHGGAAFRIEPTGPGAAIYIQGSHLVGMPLSGDTALAAAFLDLRRSPIGAAGRIASTTPTAAAAGAEFYRFDDEQVTLVVSGAELVSAVQHDPADPLPDSAALGSALSSVVKVTHREAGSGTVVGPRLVLTAAHVVSGVPVDDIIVDGMPAVAVVELPGDARDLAFVVTQRFIPRPALPIRQRPLRTGEALIIAGNPNHVWTVTYGAVRGVTTDEAEIDATTSGGASGGLVAGADLAVAGVMSRAGLGHSHRVIVVVPADRVADVAGTTSTLLRRLVDAGTDRAAIEALAAAGVKVGSRYRSNPVRETDVAMRLLPAPGTSGPAGTGGTGGAAVVVGGAAVGVGLLGGTGTARAVELVHTTGATTSWLTTLLDALPAVAAVAVIGFPAWWLLGKLLAWIERVRAGPVDGDAPAVEADRPGRSRHVLNRLRAWWASPQRSHAGWFVLAGGLVAALLLHSPEGAAIAAAAGVPGRSLRGVLKPHGSDLDPAYGVGMDGTPLDPEEHAAIVDVIRAAGRGTGTRVAAPAVAGPEVLLPRLVALVGDVLAGRIPVSELAMPEVGLAWLAGTHVDAGLGGVTIRGGHRFEELRMTVFLDRARTDTAGHAGVVVNQVVAAHLARYAGFRADQANMIAVLAEARVNPAYGDSPLSARADLELDQLYLHAPDALVPMVGGHAAARDHIATTFTGLPRWRDELLRYADAFHEAAVQRLAMQPVHAADVRPELVRVQEQLRAEFAATPLLSTPDKERGRAAVAQLWVRGEDGPLLTSGPPTFDVGGHARALLVTASRTGIEITVADAIGLAVEHGVAALFEKGELGALDRERWTFIDEESVLAVLAAHVHTRTPEPLLGAVRDLLGPRWPRFPLWPQELVAAEVADGRLPAAATSPAGEHVDPTGTEHAAARVAAHETGVAVYIDPGHPPAFGAPANRGPWLRANPDRTMERGSAPGADVSVIGGGRLPATVQLHELHPVPTGPFPVAALAPGTVLVRTGASDLQHGPGTAASATLVTITAPRGLPATVSATGVRLPPGTRFVVEEDALFRGLRTVSLVAIPARGTVPGESVDPLLLSTAPPAWLTAGDRLVLPRGDREPKAASGDIRAALDTARQRLAAGDAGGARSDLDRATAMVAGLPRRVIGRSAAPKVAALRAELSTLTAITDLLAEAASGVPDVLFWTAVADVLARLDALPGDRSALRAVLRDPLVRAWLRTDTAIEDVRLPMPAELGGVRKRPAWNATTARQRLGMDLLAALDATTLDPAALKQRSTAAITAAHSAITSDLRTGLAEFRYDGSPKVEDAIEATAARIAQLDQLAAALGTDVPSVAHWRREIPVLRAVVGAIAATDPVTSWLRASAAVELMAVGGGGPVRMPLVEALLSRLERGAEPFWPETAEAPPALVAAGPRWLPGAWPELTDVDRWALALYAVVDPAGIGERLPRTRRVGPDWLALVRLTTEESLAGKMFELLNTRAEWSSADLAAWMEVGRRLAMLQTRWADPAVRALIFPVLSTTESTLTGTRTGTSRALTGLAGALAGLTGSGGEPVRLARNGRTESAPDATTSDRNRRSPDRSPDHPQTSPPSTVDESTTTAPARAPPGALGRLVGPVVDRFRGPGAAGMLPLPALGDGGWLADAVRFGLLGAAAVGVVLVLYKVARRPVDHPAAGIRQAAVDLAETSTHPQPARPVVVTQPDALPVTAGSARVGSGVVVRSATPERPAHVLVELPADVLWAHPGPAGRLAVAGRPVADWVGPEPHERLPGVVSGQQVVVAAVWGLDVPAVSLAGPVARFAHAAGVRLDHALADDAGLARPATEDRADGSTLITVAKRPTTAVDRGVLDRVVRRAPVEVLTRRALSALSGLPLAAFEHRRNQGLKVVAGFGRRTWAGGGPRDALLHVGDDGWFYTDPAVLAALRAGVLDPAATRALFETALLMLSDVAAPPRERAPPAELLALLPDLAPLADVRGTRRSIADHLVRTGKRPLAALRSSFFFEPDLAVHGAPQHGSPDPALPVGRSTIGAEPDVAATFAIEGWDLMPRRLRASITAAHTLLHELGLVTALTAKTGPVRVRVLDDRAVQRAWTRGDPSRGRAPVAWAARDGSGIVLRRSMFRGVTTDPERPNGRLVSAAAILLHEWVHLADGPHTAVSRSERNAYLLEDLFRTTQTAMRALRTATPRQRPARQAVVAAYRELLGEWRPWRSAPRSYPVTTVYHLPAEPGGGMVLSELPPGAHQQIVLILQRYLSGLPDDRYPSGRVRLDWAQWQEAFAQFGLDHLGRGLIAYTVFDEAGRAWYVEWAHVRAEIDELLRRGVLDEQFEVDLAAHEERHAADPHAAGWASHRTEVGQLAGALRDAGYTGDPAAARPSLLRLLDIVAETPGTAREVAAAIGVSYGSALNRLTGLREAGLLDVERRARGTQIFRPRAELPALLDEMVHRYLLPSGERFEALDDLAATLAGNPSFVAAVPLADVVTSLIGARAPTITLGQLLIAVPAAPGARAATVAAQVGMPRDVVQRQLELLADVGLLAGIGTTSTWWFTRPADTDELLAALAVEHQPVLQRVFDRLIEFLGSWPDRLSRHELDHARWVVGNAAGLLAAPGPVLSPTPPAVGDTVGDLIRGGSAARSRERGEPRSAAPRPTGAAEPTIADAILDSATAAERGGSERGGSDRRGGGAGAGAAIGGAIAGFGIFASGGRAEAAGTGPSATADRLTSLLDALVGAGLVLIAAVVAVILIQVAVRGVVAVVRAGHGRLLAGGVLLGGLAALVVWGPLGAPAGQLVTALITMAGRHWFELAAAGAFLGGFAVGVPVLRRIGPGWAAKLATERRRMFASFAEPNFRMVALAQFGSLVGTWMQISALGIVVLLMPGGGPTALGFMAAFQQAPGVLLSVAAGSLADRMNRRLVVQVAMAVQGLAAGVLGVLHLVDALAVWHVYAVAAVLGTASTFTVAAQRLLNVELVGEQRLQNAIALNSTSAKAAKLIGPLLAGIVVAVGGSGWVFLVNALSFGGVVVAMMRLKHRPLFEEAAPVEREPNPVRAGWRYVRTHRELRGVLALTFATVTFGVNLTLVVPLMAAQAGGGFVLTAFQTLQAVGGFAAALWFTRRTTLPTGRFVAAIALALGATGAMVALAPGLWLTAVAMLAAEFAAVAFYQALQAYTQLRVERGMVGRVGGFTGLLTSLSSMIGGPLLGWLAESWGPSGPALVGGTVTVVAAVIALRTTRASPPGGGAVLTVAGLVGAALLLPAALGTGRSASADTAVDPAVGISPPDALLRFGIVVALILAVYAFHHPRGPPLMALRLRHARNALDRAREVAAVDPHGARGLVDKAQAHLDALRGRIDTMTVAQAHTLMDLRAEAAALLADLPVPAGAPRPRGIGRAALQWILRLFGGGAVVVGTIAATALVGARPASAAPTNGADAMAGATVAGATVIGLVVVAGFWWSSQRRPVPVRSVPRLYRALAGRADLKEGCEVRCPPVDLREGLSGGPAGLLVCCHRPRAGSCP